MCVRTELGVAGAGRGRSQRVANWNVSRVCPSRVRAWLGPEGAGPPKMPNWNVPGWGGGEWRSQDRVGAGLGRPGAWPMDEGGASGLVGRGGAWPGGLRSGSCCCFACSVWGRPGSWHLLGCCSSLISWHTGLSWTEGLLLRELSHDLFCTFFYVFIYIFLHT